MANDKPSLNYLGFNVSKIVFDIGDLLLKKDDGKFKVSLNFAPGINEDDKNDFAVIFWLSITNSIYKEFNLQVEANGLFFIEGEYDAITFKNFTEISAPSIVYPYLRSFVSTVALQAGLKPLFIPSVNFINLSREKDLKESVQQTELPD